MNNKILLAAALGINLAWAGAAGAETFSLEQAIAYALAHHPDLLAARERAAAETARREAAEGARLPQLGASVRARRSDNPLDVFADKLNTRRVAAQDFEPARLNNPDASDLYVGQLALRLPVYTGGRLAAQVEGARGTERDAQLRHERGRELTAFQARRAYLGALAAQEGLAIAEDALKAAGEHARTTAALVREGRIVVSDKLTAEVNLAAMQSARAQAATRRQRALDRLKLAMGLPLEREIEIQPAVTAAAPALRALDEIEASALAHRKDLAGSRAAQGAAQSHIQAARAAHRPQFDVIASQNWFDNDPALENRSTSVMGVLSLDLYAGGSHAAQVSAATAEAKEVDWRTQSQEQQVRSEVREAYDNLHEARARHAIAAENVERARETVRLVKQRYGQGRTILIDLLQAERALVEARNEELISRLNLETGYAALRLAEGVLELPEGGAQ